MCPGRPLRSRLLRSGAENVATPGQPVRPEVVTYVSGMNRYPCIRNRPGIYRRARRDSNPRPPDSKSGVEVFTGTERNGLAPAFAWVYTGLASCCVQLNTGSSSKKASPVCPRAESQEPQTFRGRRRKGNSGAPDPHRFCLQDEAASYRPD
jgi:hypothetical protein